MAASFMLENASFMLGNASFILGNASFQMEKIVHLATSEAFKGANIGIFCLSRLLKQI